MYMSLMGFALKVHSIFTSLPPSRPVFPFAHAAPPESKSGQGIHLHRTSEGPDPESAPRFPLLESGRHAVRHVSRRGLLLSMGDGAKALHTVYLS